VRVTLIPKGGVGRHPPLVLEAAQVLVAHDDGTPLAVAAEYGPDGGVAASHALDQDFNRMLELLGIRRTTVCDRVEVAKPPSGARLIAGPRSGQGA